MTADDDIFDGFVFGGKSYPRERVEEAARAIRRRLTPPDRNRVNDALLARLATAKEGRGDVEQCKDMLRDPSISTLVNTLVLVNEGLLHNVITKSRALKPHLQRSSVEELYAVALAGRDSLGADAHGMMGAILKYNYREYGAAAFTTYLTSAINNSLQQTPKQQQTYQRVDSRTQGNLDDVEPEWVDRKAEPPESTAINHDLLEVVRSVIPRLPTRQQRITAEFMIQRILETGERPIGAEVAQAQNVSRQRAAQIIPETLNSIREQIEIDYPQLAEDGINGWEEFKKALAGPNPTANHAHRGGGRT